MASCVSSNFEQLNFNLLERNHKIIKFLDPKQNLHIYNIIKLFPFQSSKKRMGIIVQKVNDNNDDSNNNSFISNNNKINNNDENNDYIFYI